MYEVEKIRKALWDAKQLDPRKHGKNLVWDHVEYLISRLDNLETKAAKLSVELKRLKASK